MSVSFSLPGPLEEMLRAQVGNLDDAAKEAALVEMYRQGSLSHHQLAMALGLNRFEINAVLKRRNVTEDLLTQEEFDEQMAALRRLVDQ